MHRKNQCFDFYPKVVRANTETEITFHYLLNHSLFEDQFTCEVSYYPMGGSSKQSKRTEKSKLPVRIDNGMMSFRQYLEGEEEHVFLIETVSNGIRRKVAELRIYSLRDDLFALRPYRGDFHLHSNRSGGQDSPAYVAGASRQIGLDFMTITDHRQYDPSLEAIRAFENVPIDLHIYAGEEVHPPNNRIHIINFGGQFSIL